LLLKIWRHDKESGMTMKRTLTEGCLEGMNKAAFTDEVLNAGVVEKYPELGTLSVRDQLIMVCISLGYSYRFISEALDVGVASINRTVNRVDPDRRFRVDESAKKEYIATRARSKAMEMISAITPKKIKEASMSALVKGSKGLIEVAAIIERKPALVQGDGKVKKVTIEFFDPAIDMKEADGEVCERILGTSRDFDAGDDDHEAYVCCSEGEEDSRGPASDGDLDFEP